MVSMIDEGLLSIAQADTIKDEWAARHRSASSWTASDIFRLAFRPVPYALRDRLPSGDWRT